MTDEEIYESISAELESGDYKRALWTRLYAENDGDEAKTKARYIKQRFSELASKSIDSPSETNEASFKNNDGFTISPIYLQARDFSEGFAAVLIGNDYQTAKWGYLNKDGELAISAKFDGAGDFQNGVAYVQIGFHGFSSPPESFQRIDHRKTGFIDRSGALILSPNYDSGYVVNSNCFRVLIKNSRSSADWFFVDRQGQRISEPKTNFGENGVAKQCEFFETDDLAACQFGFQPDAKVHFWEKKKVGKWGYINRRGEWVIEPRYEEAFDFVLQDLAPVKFGVKDAVASWGYINRKGNMVIPPTFRRALYFCDGLASVEVGDDRNQKSGFIDKSGRFVIGPSFRYAGHFHRGRAIVRTQDDRSGVIDKAGSWVVKPNFDDLGRSISQDGLLAACVEKSRENPLGKWGYITVR
jgi:hypothetical protein